MLEDWLLGRDDLTEGHGEAVRTQLKTKEEIDLYSLPENLSERDLATRLLASSLRLQQCAALSLLPKIVEAHGWSAISPLLPRISALLKDPDSDLAGVIAETVVHMLELIGTTDQPALTQLCPLVITQLTKRSLEVRQAWLTVSHTLMRGLSIETTEAQLLPLALKLGHVSESHESRIIACQLLGQLGMLLPASTIENAFLEQAIALCQDTHHLVRCAMCRQLCVLAGKLGHASSESVIWPELVELVSDEEREVRKAAFNECVAFVDCTSAAFRKRNVHTLIASLYAKLALSDELVVDALLRARTLVGCGSDELVGALVDFLRKASASAEISQRLGCAHCLAGVGVYSSGSTAPQKLLGQLLPLFSKLARDTSPAVRAAAAAHMGLVIDVLGAERVVPSLREVLLAMLQDADLTVVDAIVGALPSMTRHFLPREAQDTRPGFCRDVYLTLVELDQRHMVGTRWRLQLKLLQLLHLSPDFLPAELIAEGVVPCCIRILQNGATVLRAEGARALCRIVQKTRSLAQRHELLLRIIREFGRGRSYQLRLIFLEICVSMFEYFSNSFIKAYIFDSLLEVCMDAVANVRIGACKVLPLLKKALQYHESVDVPKPYDGGLTERLVNCVLLLLKDGDSDVAVLAREVSLVVMNSDTTPPTSEQLMTEKRRREDEDVLILNAYKESKTGMSEPMHVLSDRARSDFKRRVMDKSVQAVPLLRKSSGSSTPTASRQAAARGSTQSLLQDAASKLGTLAKAASTGDHRAQPALARKGSTGAVLSKASTPPLPAPAKLAPRDSAVAVVKPGPKDASAAPSKVPPKSAAVSKGSNPSGTVGAGVRHSSASSKPGSTSRESSPFRRSTVS